jgi:hypothetical protein
MVLCTVSILATMTFSLTPSSVSSALDTRSPKPLLSSDANVQSPSNPLYIPDQICARCDVTHIFGQIPREDHTDDAERPVEHQRPRVPLKREGTFSAGDADFFGNDCVVLSILVGRTDLRRFQTAQPASRPLRRAPELKYFEVFCRLPCGLQGCVRKTKLGCPMGIDLCRS